MQLVRYPLKATPGTGFSMPLVPITLANAAVSLATEGLVDSGSAINVLPFAVGTQLGLDWSSNTTVVPLTGGLSNVEARAVVLDGRIANFEEVELVFAWCSKDVPLILGHTNFLDCFDFALRRKQGYFELSAAV